MYFRKLIFPLIASLCSLPVFAATTTPDFWKNATVYFMMTDRFNNADPSNDNNYNRTEKPALMRGFEGGDIKGITQKIADGYFTELGVDAIWMTPLVEQIHGYDDSDGVTYAYHGYWPKDWTSVDANFGTEADLQEMIKTAHRHGIKVLMDVIINHTGPETLSDWAWPSDWVRTEPVCNWKNYQQNTQCALATSLTDIKTEINDNVALPQQLLDKWKKEGRLTKELAELDAFFTRSGYPRAPKYYIVKWLTDWVRDYGVDGFRVDTVKHIEPEIWDVLRKESELAFQYWKDNNPDHVKDDLPFYMVGEVFNWGLNGFKHAAKDGRAYDFGDKQIDFFDYGFDALINMAFPTHAHLSEEDIFSEYSKALNGGTLDGKGILNYIGSHDDVDSYDKERKNTFEAAFKLMLAPGGVQIYYGDELARPMHAIEGANGDAHLRRFMNWQDLSKASTQELLAHWQRLGTFRHSHPAVGAGIHRQLSESPYIFERTLDKKDKVLVAKDLPKGSKTLQVYNLFNNGEKLFDYYSGQHLVVKNGKITLTSPFSYILLGKSQ